MADPTSAQELEDVKDLAAREAEAKAKLEKLLAHRPEKTELVEKNVLKPGNLDPSLQATQIELAKNQLEDKLNVALSHRPKPDELVKEGILNEDEAPAIKHE
ncbi:uncharacterized protein MELLADRAFT_71686 [Melampsora larici-populina 98AG31]|uniref:RPEL repeat protein n=1 Tax=Melampsora larici-populina (strain 98AG31 / pathotype 3-4-7) TaxID=747676 RepID=F4RJG7_MELLP|nr:uncharacterized protein MELLADRAFT_71686 [Melampsora larici-populina 98AG31]EGG07307.1 hypothetical protein MELLADRAFT_71686 [Melampsora larici-populina 98AG31]